MNDGGPDVRDALSAYEALSFASLRERLDRVIDGVTRELVTAQSEDGLESQRPCWVPPAEFVRLIRPHIGWN